MYIFPTIADLRFQDVLDILFLCVVAYHLYLWFKGTKAFKALVGLLVLGVIFTVARTWGLFMTTWVFQILWQVLVILLIILFQSEIRQALERVNPLQALGLRKHGQPGKWVQVLAEASFLMARRHIGALMILERADRVDEWVTSGQQLEAALSPELALSIFQKQSPLHDGAMVLRGGRITLVACYLPLSSNEVLPNEWGTRHRAAAGLSERCDAMVIVASEERGEVTLVQNGSGVAVRSPEDLSRRVIEGIRPLTPAKRTPWEKSRSLILNQWRTKLGTFGLIAILWVMLAGQQDFEVTLSVPVEVKNLPAQLTFLEPPTQMVRVKVRGLRKDASTLSGKGLQVGIDLSTATQGKRTYPLTRAQIQLPNEKLQVVSIDPPQLTLSLEKKI
jgi:diadenylate cyclase